MSRSALWRQEGNVKERELKALQTFHAAIAAGRQAPQRGIIPLIGPDDTFNLHPMLLQNISKSGYFQKCCEKLTDWSTLVDEIYYEVKHMEPWTAGAHRSPSTAFCLLLRLFTLRCTEKQMTLMLDHVDSPYIRCIGLLYLRYAADPGSLWSWFEPYLHDAEPVQVRQGQAETTLGQYAQSLLGDLDYYGTRLPRLPLAIERQFKVKLLQAERAEERAQRHFKNEAAMEYFQKVGARIQALYGDDENPITWYDAVVERVIMRDRESGKMLARPKFEVHFPEYGNTEVVSLGELDLPGSNGAKPPTSSEAYDSRGDAGRGRGNSYGRGDDRGGWDDDDYRGDRGRRDDRYDRGGAAARGSRGYPDERRGYPDERRRARSRSRSCERGDGLTETRREEKRRKEARREEAWRKEARREEERREEARREDARREEQELLEEVLRRERDNTAAKGRSYAARPATFKESLGTPKDQSRHLAGCDERRSRGRGGKTKAEDGNVKDRKPVAAPVVQKTDAELAAIEDKKRKLRARYG